MIKRIVLLLALGLALSVIATPALIGVALERSEPNLLRALSRRPDGVVVEQRQFQRRWFDSQSQWRMIAVDSGDRMDLAVSYRHGPWLGGPGWLGFKAALVPDEHGASGVATARVGLGFDVDGQLIAAWPGALDLDARYRYQRRADALSVEIQRLTGAVANATLDGGRGNLTLGPLRRGALSGTAALELDALAVAGAQLEQGRVATTLSGTREAFDLSVELAAKRLDVAGEALTDAHGQARLQGLHRWTLRALLATARNRWDTGLRGPALTEQLKADVLLVVPALLRRQPRLVLDGLGWRSDGGAASASGHLGFSGPPPAGFLADPTRLAPVLDLALGAELPQAQLQRWAPKLAGEPPAGVPAEAVGDEWLTRMRANRIIVPTATHYRLDLDYREQQLVLNGQPMMLPSF